MLSFGSKMPEPGSIRKCQILTLKIRESRYLDITLRIGEEKAQTFVAEILTAHSTTMPKGLSSIVLVSADRVRHFNRIISDFIAGEEVSLPITLNDNSIE